MGFNCKVQQQIKKIRGNQSTKQTIYSSQLIKLHTNEIKFSNEAIKP